MTMEFSDETLNAFVDGELAAEQRAELLAAMEADRALGERVCRLRSLKEKVQLAFRDPPAPPRRCPKPPARWLAVAATLLLFLGGGVLGWYLHPVVESSERFALIDQSGTGDAPAAADSDAMRIVFHLTSPDSTEGGDLLNEVEGMLEKYRQQGRPLRVEVVAYGDGLSLLRERLSRHKGRIEALAGQYDNLTFVACANTIRRAEVMEGREVVLLPNAELTESGVAHVVQRQREGWAYIRI